MGEGIFEIDDKNKARQQRKEMCEEAGVSVREWSPQTLKTNLNALAHLYKNTKPEVGVVFSSEKQFPLFTVFLNGAIKKSKEKQSVLVKIQPEISEISEISFRGSVNTPKTKSEMCCNFNCTLNFISPLELGMQRPPPIWVLGLPPLRGGDQTSR